MQQVSSRLRLATFNVENLDDGLPRVRLDTLRDTLVRLRADVLCLQEVNAQKPRGGGDRYLAALSGVIEGTPYAGYHWASTLAPNGHPLQAHNLVVLSRLPLAAVTQVRHELVPAPLYRTATALPAQTEPAPIAWERPLLQVRIDVTGIGPLHLLNLHLRAPRAAPIPGQKQGAAGWRSTAGWGEGFFVAAVKRAGQALEARLVVDRLLDADPQALVVVAGDLNADLNEMPLRILAADPDDVATPALAGHALVAAEEAVAPDRRFTVRHHGRRVMLDHLLVSAALYPRIRTVEIDNRVLADEAEFREIAIPGGSFHAPLLAEFDLE